MANGTLKALQDNENGIGQAEDNKVELLNKWRLQMYEDITWQNQLALSLENNNRCSYRSCGAGPSIEILDLAELLNHQCIDEEIKEVKVGLSIANPGKLKVD